MDSEIVELVLKVTGASSIEEATGKLRALKETYDVLERQVGEYAVAEGGSSRATDEAVRKAVEETQARKALNQVLAESTIRQDALATAVTTTAGAHGNMGRGILQTSYAVQDFTSQLGTSGLAGALNAVQNNIPGILSGLGAGAGLAGVLSVAAVGIGLVYQNWEKLSNAFNGTKEKLPELKEGLEGLKESLKEIDDAIEKLEKQAKSGGLNLFDEEKLAKLRGIKLQGEQQQADEKLVSGVGPEAGRAAREIAAAVKEALGTSGGGDAAAQNLAMNTGMSAIDATAVVAGAMRGNGTDLDTLRRNAPTFGAAYDRVSPERKTIDALNKQGQDLEGQTSREFDRELEAKRRRVEARQKADDASIEQAADLEDKAADDARRAQERAARKAAHDADPSNRLAATAAAQQDAVTSEAMRQWQAGGRRESIPDLQRIISGAVHALPDAGGDVARAVQMAAQQAYQKAQMDIARAMQRQQVWSEQRQ